ncbi:MAG: hypothetical protein PHN31_06775 [Candidatus Gracilibacteria bacterium]|nr:hypothetical protein [Candidatus Gracilibacteria bacterium]
MNTANYKSREIPSIQEISGYFLEKIGQIGDNVNSSIGKIMDNFNPIHSIKANLERISDGIKISEYHENEHKKNKYGNEFIYIINNKNSKVYVIEGVELSKFEEVKKTLNNKDFDIFCYSNKKTGTSYNSYTPIEGGVVLETKPKIMNIIDFKK